MKKPIIPGTPLTPTETLIRDFVIQGLKNHQIAKQLFISEKTVKFHLNNIYKRTGLQSRWELIAKHYHPTHELQTTVEKKLVPIKGKT